MNDTKTARLSIKLFLSFCVFSFAGSSQAGLITVDSILNSTVIDFSTQSTVSNAVGPIQIGSLVNMDVTVAGDPNNGLYMNFNGWGLASNGTWGAGATYVSANNARPGDLIFTFNDGPVSAVGGFMNHCRSCISGGGADLIITALDIYNNVLESYNITSLADIVTPNAVNGGAFRGITRNTADISQFVVSGYVQVLDDLTFSASPVPAPAPFGIFLMGIMVLFRLNSRRS